MPDRGKDETATPRTLAVGDMDNLGVCDECRDVAFWMAAEETEDGVEIVPYCGDHRPEVDNVD